MQEPTHPKFGEGRRRGISKERFSLSDLPGPQNFGQLSHYARKALRRMRKRPSLVIAFWRQAELFPL
jgi:hypothetical protein